MGQNSSIAGSLRGRPLWGEGLYHEAIARLHSGITTIYVSLSCVWPSTTSRARKRRQVTCPDGIDDTSEDDHSPKASNPGLDSTLAKQSRFSK